MEPTDVFFFATDLGLDIWRHVAIVRKDGKFMGFVDGKRVAETEVSNAEFNLGSTVHGLMTCSYQGDMSQYPLDGYLDDFVILDYALWNDDFTPPGNYLVNTLKKYQITEQYQDQNGNELQADVIKTVAEGSGYIAIAPDIDDYVCLGYKVDDGDLNKGDTVTIAAVDANHTVTFVYVKKDSLTDPLDMNLYLKLEIGNSVRLLGYVLPILPTAQKLVWSSENSSIASVDSNGRVTAHSVGETRIFVQTQDGSWSAFARI